MKKLFLFIKVTIFLAAVFSLIQLIINPFFATNPDFISRMDAEFFEVRRKSIFGYTHRLDVGMSFVPLFSVLLSVFLLEKLQVRSCWVYVVCAAIVCLSVNSRWVMVNFLLSLGLFVVYSKFMITSVVRYVGVVVFALGAFVGLAYFINYDLQGVIQNRIIGTGDHGRFLSVKLFFHFFSQNPIWGRGYHITASESVLLESVKQIHIGYLAFLDHWGGVGGFLQFSFWGLLMAKLVKDSKRNGFWGATFAFGLFLVANLTLVNYWILHYGLIISFVFNRYFSDLVQKRTQFTKFNY